MGAHEWVGGGAVTVGKLRVEGTEFDINVKRLPVPVVPDVSQVNTGEDVEAEDMRVLFGFFLHDTWAIHPRVSLSAGGRVDLAHEELEGKQEVSPGVDEEVKDEREDTGWSADGGLLYRLLSQQQESGPAFNLFANVRRNFKPAAPNVFEAAEGVKILEPETSVAFEGGFKSRFFDGQAALEGSVFQMDLENQVIVEDNGGTPELVNAGKTRFKGEEVKLRLAPAALGGLALEGGYAHHDPRFVRFTRPNGASVDGKQVELAPKELWNVGASWAAPKGASIWVAARGQGERPYNKRNTFFAEAYTEWDAGASCSHGPWRLAFIGRNLSDSRHVVAESEIGDSQFYFATPRRLTAQVSIRL
jgi:outer membrane receptor protein involved in Fe transport